MNKRTIRRRVAGVTLIPMAALAVMAARPEAPEAAPAAARASLRLHADISQRKLTLYSNGEAIRSYDVAVGTKADPTPRGAFKIRKLVWNPGWVPPDEKWAKGKSAKEPGEKGNPMKVVKIFFREPDYYIHGTPHTSSLGTAASHGCLRMSPSQAAEVGQYLMDHGGSPRPESWFRRVLRFRSQTKVIYLDNPITIEITS